jgi:hypothetical protein
LGPQVEAFLQNYPFASARTIAKHFLTTASIVKEILQRELRMRKFSRRWVPHSLSDAQKSARVETAEEISRILQQSEMNDFDGIATGDEPWFQHTMASSKMFARSAADVIPRTRQAVGAKNYNHGVLHRKETYRVRRSSKRQHIQSAIFHQSHIPRFEHNKPEFWAPEDKVNLSGAQDNFMYHNGSKVTSEK